MLLCAVCACVPVREGRLQQRMREQRNCIRTDPLALNGLEQSLREENLKVEERSPYETKNMNESIQNAGRMPSLQRSCIFLFRHLWNAKKVQCVGCSYEVHMHVSEVGEEGSHDDEVYGMSRVLFRRLSALT